MNRRLFLTLVFVAMLLGVQAQVTLQPGVQFETVTSQTHIYQTGKEVTTSGVTVYDDALEIGGANVTATTNHPVEFTFWTHSFAGGGTHAQYINNDTVESLTFSPVDPDKLYRLKINGTGFTSFQGAGSITFTNNSNGIQPYSNITIDSEPDIQTATVEISSSDYSNVIADGENITEGSYPGLDYPYISLDDWDQTYSVVTREGYKNASYQESGGEATLKVHTQLGTGNVFVATTERGYQSIEEERQEFLSGNFLSQPLASFTWESPDDYTITASVEYSDLNLTMEENNIDARDWRELSTQYEQDDPENRVNIQPN